MRRSSGVTAAAICVVAASVAWCVYVLWTLRPAGREGFALLLAGSIFTLLFGVWGIATGIGLLRLRRWAWACVLVISAVMILFSVPELLGAPHLIRATTGVPTISAGHFVLLQYFHLIALGIVPVILGIWWLAFFLRRSVRLQFAGALAEVAEGTAIASRSGAVDASAIVLFFGSALLLLLAVIAPLSAYAAPQPQSVPPFPFRGMLIGVGIFYVLVAAWVVVTGVGVIKRRAWGRILMIVTGAIGIAFCVLGSAGAILGMTVAYHDPRIPASAMHGAVLGAISVMLIPLAISIWWLVLFTRPRIALEFGPAHLGAGTAGSIPWAVISREAKPSAAFPVQTDVSAPAVFPVGSGPLQIPMSVRVIAVVEILYGLMAAVGPLFAESTGMKPATLIFGFLAHGWSIDAFYITSGIVPIVFCVAILLRRRWGLDGLIVFLLAEIANLALFLVSPARGRFDVEMQAQMQSYMSHIKMPDGSAPPPSPVFTHLNLLYGVSFGLTIVLFAVLLYFLFTRRRAFRVACSAPPSLSGSGPASAQGIAS